MGITKPTVTLNPSPSRTLKLPPSLNLHLPSVADPVADLAPVAGGAAVS